MILVENAVFFQLTLSLLLTYGLSIQSWTDNYNSYIITKYQHCILIKVHIKGIFENVIKENF